MEEIKKADRRRNITPARRKDIAAMGAKARAEKRQKQKLEAEAAAAVSQPEKPAPPPEPVPEPPAPPSRRRRPKERPVPQVFGQALAAAEKEYAKSLEDLSYHEGMVVMLRNRIPFLTQTIRALGGAVGSSAVPNGASPMNPDMPYMPSAPLVPSSDLPPIPVARGGAMGVIDDGRVDENVFLREEGTIAAGGGWK